MKEKSSTLFLKLVIILMALFVLIICTVAVPIDIAHHGFGPVWIFLYLSAIPFYICLWQGFQMLRFIDNNTAFSEKSIEALRKIKWAAFSITLLLWCCYPWVFKAAESEDAPGMVLIWLAFSGAPFVVGVFAVVLRRVLESAIALKSENDLTV